IYKSVNDISKFSKLENTLKNIHDLFKKDWAEDELEFTQFSDSIVISIPENYSGGVYYIISNAGFAMHMLFKNGYTCKGVISVGKLYHKGNLLFGPEFINVMKLEAAEDLPRIKFSEKLLDIAKQHPGEGNTGNPNLE